MKQFLENNRYLIWFIFISLWIVDVFVLQPHFDLYVLLLIFFWWLVIKAFRLESRFSIFMALICWLGVFMFTLLRLGIPAYKLAHWSFLFLSFGVVQQFFPLKKSLSIWQKLKELRPK